MRFGENLKKELAYSGMLKKELATISGVHKRAIDTYVRAKSSMPPADAAVKIANALGVSVEYLVTGKETALVPQDIRLITRRLLQLNEKDRKVVSVLINALLGR
jgi:transcriptional regulator with XRE-family HTH domain